MENRKIQISVGLFVCMVVAAVLFLCLKVANTSLIGRHDMYRVYAIFDNIGGLKPNSPIKIGGVVIGRIKAITLKREDEMYKPYVVIDIEKQYNQIPMSSALSIKTSGVLGEQYIAIDLGIHNSAIDELDRLDSGDNSSFAENKTTQDNGAYFREGFIVHNTKPAVVLEDLIGQFLYKKGFSPTK